MRIPSLSTVRFAVLVALVLALFTSGIVVGAAGSPLILGQGNTAGANQTQLSANQSAAVFKVTQNGSGVPLSLSGPTDRPPMVVNSHEKVIGLNADRVDGKNAGQFRPSATYLVNASAAVAANSSAHINAFCDPGDLALGGGFYDWSLDTTRIWDNWPAGLSSWRLFVTTGAEGETLFVYVLCSDFAPAHVTTLSAEEPQRDEVSP